MNYLIAAKPKFYKFWYWFCMLSIIMNFAGVGTLSFKIDNAEACVVQPYCGDKVVNQSWEKCDGNAPQACTTASGYTGTKSCNSCIWGECVPTQSCGDGTVNGTETCDNGDANGQACTAEYGGSCTYCSTACAPIEVTGEYCGDNIKNGGDPSTGSGQEECDGLDGLTAHAVCTPDCRLETTPYCGDETVNNDEICELNTTESCSDDSGYGGVKSCQADCSGWSECVPQESCGDGVKNDNEQCDGQDGVSDHYTCTDQCILQYLPYCGDGEVNQCDEECDGVAGLPNDHYNCTNECKLNYIPYCGDNKVNQDSEQCDDGNSADGDGCNSACQTEATPPVCGDGEKNQDSEQCDTGDANGIICNAPYGGTCSYCTSDCTEATVKGAYCGDNILNDAEVCDGTATSTPDHYQCTNECKFEYIPYCGDNILNQDTEECDGTAEAAPEHYQCNNECKLIYQPYCGDSKVNTDAETCDLGNANGQACAAVYGQTCTYCSAECQNTTVKGPYCGDNIKNGEEQCDDGNTVNGDGCNSTCQTEVPSGPTCGDGLCNGQENCSSCTADCDPCGSTPVITGGGAVPVWFLTSVSTPAPAPVPEPEIPVVKGEAGEPVLVIAKDVKQDIANPGDTNIEYVITVNNTGNLTAYEVVLNDVLPSGLSFADNSGNTKSWALGDIKAGDIIRISYLVNVDANSAPKSYTNVAKVKAANYGEKEAEVKLEVKTVKVLAATGFNNFEFLAIILSVLALFGVSRKLNGFIYPNN